MCAFFDWLGCLIFTAESNAGLAIVPDFFSSSFALLMHVFRYAGAPQNKRVLKQYIFAFSLLMSYALLGQNTTHSISWQSSEVWHWGQAPSEKYVLLPVFKDLSFDESVSPYPFIRIWLPLQNGLRVEGVQLVSPEYKMHESLLKDLKPTPANAVIKFGVAYESKNAQLYVDICPYRFQNGKLELLKSFGLNYTTQPVSLKANTSASYKNQSVLSTGRWYKVAVDQTGIYKISPKFLSDQGIDLNNVNPSHIRVYGNGNGMLPESNSIEQTDDLEEIPVLLVENGNGRFEGSDYILFYARSPHQWQLNNGRFTHIQNLYNDLNYYFITFDLGPSKSPSLVAEPSGTVSNVVNSFDDYSFVERDLENLVGSGKQWFGEKFDFTPSYNFSFNFPNRDISSPISIRARAVARSASSGSFLSFSSQGQSLLQLNFAAVDVNSPGADFVRQSSDEANFNSALSALTITTTFNNGGNPSAVAWLDYIELQTRRRLSFASGIRQLIFRDLQSVGPGQLSEFVLEAGNNSVHVWDVSQKFNILELPYQFVGSQIRIKALTDTLREFVAFYGSDFPSPNFVSAVDNQNIHAEPTPELVLLYHPSLEQPALRLAEFHRNFSNLKVLAVSTAQVYNEFGSGSPDLTAIKNMMRMFYERSTPTSPLKYLNLFGDASYDYKDRTPNNTNLIPNWQSDFSFSLRSSLGTDDYFGFLDPDEGGVTSSARLDVGIGRLVARNTSEASNLVDKIIRYASEPAGVGDWRSKILFAADDVDESWETQLMRAAELAAQAAESRDKRFNQQKVYLDAYQQEISGGSQRYPQAREDFIRAIESGNLLSAYTGHGGEIGLASERFLQISDLQGFSNTNAMPVFITITCEFTRYDDPKRVSAGEWGHLNPSGGFIALFSTQRVVYANPATLGLTRQIIDTIFTRFQGQTITMGDVVRIVKNKSGNSDKLSFSLFGDPALKLAVPEFNIETTEINGQSVIGFQDTIKALSKVKVKGRVTDLSGQLLSSFNGVVRPVVFDKALNRQTLVNDGVESPQSFSERKSIVYKGLSDVKSGEFEFEFIVPLDISYQFGNGRIAYYAQDGLTDAAGYFEDFIVGGIDTMAKTDQIGPNISLYLNDVSFVNGGITNQRPDLFAQISDSSGINTVGRGIGRDILAVLDGDFNNALVLNEYYQADLNTYKSGNVRYGLRNLSEGPHTLTLRAWDVYNNPSESNVDFVVANSSALALRYVLNYPNPFTNYTEFQFEHNRAQETLEVMVQIFTVSGKLVKTIRREIFASGNRVTGIDWDGLDDFGDQIGKGAYIYKLSVRSKSDLALAEEYQKLVILR